MCLRRTPALLVALVACGAPRTEQPAPATLPVVSTPRPAVACPDVPAAIAATEALLAEGKLDRAGRRLAHVRERCVSAALDARLVRVWIDQGRLAAAAAILAAHPGWPDAEALGAALDQAIHAARSPEALLAEARAAEAASDAVAARRRYDRALAAFERESGHAAEITSLRAAAFDDPLRVGTGPSESAGLRAAPAYDMHGVRGYVVTAKSDPDRPRRWFASDDVYHRLVVLGDRIIADHSRGQLSLLDGGTTQLGSIGGPAAPSPSGERLVWLSTPALVLDAASLAVLARLDVNGPRSARWLDDDRVVVHAEESAMLFDLSREPPLALTVEGIVTISSRSGRYLAAFQPVFTPTPDGRGRVVVHDLLARGLVLDVEVPRRWHAAAMAISPDEERLALVANDGTAHFFALPSGHHRRVGSPTPVDSYAERELEGAIVGNDGWLCTYLGFHKYGSCEPEVAFHVTRGVPRPPPGRRLACFEHPTTGVAVLALPTQALSSPSRTILPSGSRPAVDFCNRALSPDRKHVAWLEARELPPSDPSAPGLADLVLVIAEARSLRLLHAIDLSVPPATPADISARLDFLDERTLDATVADTTTRFDVATGAHRQLVAEGAPATIRGVLAWRAVGSQWMWDVRDGGRTPAAAEPPGPEAFAEGRRFTLEGRHVVRLEDASGRHLVSLRFFDGLQAVAQYPGGAVGLVGDEPPPPLVCRFGSWLAPLPVCAERLLALGHHDAALRGDLSFLDP